MPFSVLIIGLGNIGMRYDMDDPDVNGHIFTHARAFSRHKEYELVAGVDADDRYRLDFEKRYGLPAYEDLPSALAGHSPEIVVIAVPTAVHGTCFRQLLGLHVPRAILVEKPISYSAAEAEEIVNTCKVAGVELYVNYIRISDPGAIKVRTKISQGEWGDTFRGSVYYSKGLKNNGSHFFNLLESWLGKFKTHTLIRKGRVWNDEDPEPFFLAAFENGEVVFIPVWEEAFSHYSIELLSPAGRLFYSDGGNNITWQPLVEDSHFKGYRKLSAEAQCIGNDLQRYQLNVADQLAISLNGQPAHICTGEQALLTLKNIDTITNF